MAKLNQEQTSILDKIRLRQTQEKEVSDLRHKLHINQQALNHSDNKLQIIQSERNLFRKIKNN